MRIWKNFRCKCRRFFFKNKATTNWRYSKPIRFINSPSNQCFSWVSSSIAPIADISFWTDRPETTEYAQKHWSENWYEGVSSIFNWANLDQRASSQNWTQQIDTVNVVSNWHLCPKHSLDQHLAKHPLQASFDGRTESIAGWSRRGRSQQSFRVAGKPGSKPS